MGNSIPAAQVVTAALPKKHMFAYASEVGMHSRAGRTSWNSMDVLFVSSSWTCQMKSMSSARVSGRATAKARVCRVGWGAAF